MYLIIRIGFMEDKNTKFRLPVKIFEILSRAGAERPREKKNQNFFSK